ncbi:MAG: hypothetical protein AAGI15_01140 [Pseudomonadota bacterium]
MNPTRSQRVQPLRLKALSLTDLIIGDALVTNSRCLRFLSRPAPTRAAVAPGARGQWREDGLSSQEMLALAASMARLEALWYLLRRTDARSLAETGQVRYRRIAELLPGGSATGRAAKELLDQTDAPEQRAALRAILDQWPQRPTIRMLPASDRGRLQSLLAQDAADWQQAVDLLTPQALTPVQQAFKRSYRKLRRAFAERGAQDTPSPERLARLATLAARVAAQLELLAPALSEGSSRQLWYLQRLERNLRRRRDLALFLARLQQLESRDGRLGSARSQARRATQRRQEIQAARTVKLAELALTRKPGEYLDALLEDIAVRADQLVLDDNGLELIDAQVQGSAPSLGDITIEEQI